MGSGRMHVVVGCTQVQMVRARNAFRSDMSPAMLRIHDLHAAMADKLDEDNACCQVCEVSTLVAVTTCAVCQGCWHDDCARLVVDGLGSLDHRAFLEGSILKECNHDRALVDAIRGYRPLQDCPSELLCLMCNSFLR
eukprot:13358486-Alexandrium_andersonii.AAC.1